MSSVAEVVDAVVGVDTHSEFHQFELASPVGAALVRATLPNSEAGFAAAIAWIAAHTPGPRLMVGIEGTRSYGVGLARALTAAGLTVVEVEQPSAKQRRGKGKSDVIDAHHAVRTVLAMDPAKLAVPRGDGDREALRILLNGHREMTDTRCRQLNELRALLLTGEEADRQFARGPFSLTRLTQIARRRGRASESRTETTRREEARRLALACRDSHRELQARRAQILELVEQIVPGLTCQRGVGPISAAQLIISFSHVGRFRSEAAFAKLGGAAPVDATSGKTANRHRLNYGGDRQLNRALHDIAMNRMRYCPETQAYVARRRAEGKTFKEIRRCLKRYIARQQFRRMTSAMA